FQAEDGIRDKLVTGVQTCALPIYDVEASGAIYEWIAALCRRLGAADEDLVPFEKYAAAASALKTPSSAARALSSGAPNIERIDRSEERRVGKECRSRWWWYS